MSESKTVYAAMAAAALITAMPYAAEAATRQYYVAAEDVEEITDGAVRLRLRKDEIERLPEYSEPPASERIVPE